MRLDLIAGMGRKMKTSMTIRTYSELLHIHDFYDRYEYLRLRSTVGEDKFGWRRYLNQAFYSSSKWRKIRNKIIIRDNGCDLAHEDFEIYGRIYIHHLNPITIEDIENETELAIDPEFLVCVSFDTHNAIHYGDKKLLPQLPEERRPGDTRLW